MQGTHIFDGIRNAISLMALSLVLSGCLSDEKADAEKKEVAIVNHVTGSVGDGPVINASMRILRNDGVVLDSFVSDTFADFDIAVSTKSGNYPLTIEARDGTDLVTDLAPDFTLFGAVPVASEASTANVNPFTTFTVELARDLTGGLTAGNIASAESIVVRELNFGLSSLVASGPSSTPIDASNIAEIVKASEALSESVRRTRDLLLAFGTATSGNDVIRELSADLVDAVVDGKGGPGTDPHTAAIFTVVSVQVLLEAMSNELHVNGVDATDAMTLAIDQVLEMPADETIADQTATSEMLGSVDVGLSAAIAVSDSPGLLDVQGGVSGVLAGMTPTLVRTLLPADYRATLDEVLMLVAGGDLAVINTINNVVRNGGLEPPPNRAPTISGTAAASAFTGSNYSFMPTTSDADGDALAFSISGKPVWASFNTSTGQLSGTPSRAHEGVYSGIVITVTDGLASASLPAFSITVIVANAAPTISGNPPASVNIDTNYSFTPTANDTDGDTLTFSVSGLPDWASFNASNGNISGTPTEADVGTYSNIRITVSDGRASATLGPFSITVNSVSLGSVTLSWTPPTQNDDGTALTDLAGYKIYWGTTPGSYPNRVTISNAGISSYVVEGLAPGTYEFVATSFNASGVESVYSNSTTKVVM